MQAITSTGLCGCLDITANQPNEQLTPTAAGCARGEPLPEPKSSEPNSLAPNSGALEREVLKFTEQLFNRLTAVFERLLSALTATLRSGEVASTPPHTTLEPSGGFLWKPEAEKDGKLVILLPKSLKTVESVRVLTPDGRAELAKGRFSGVANGDRAHFRFNQPGAAFPDNALVEIAQRDGASLRVAIPNTSDRYKY